KKASIADPNLEALFTAATAYDEFFVAAHFQQWAPLVAAAAELLPGQRVLDVACGTCPVRRSCSPPGGAGVVGLDPNPGMLAVASQRNPGITSGRKRCWNGVASAKFPAPQEVSSGGMLWTALRSWGFRHSVGKSSPLSSCCPRSVSPCRMPPALKFA